MGKERLVESKEGQFGRKDLIVIANQASHKGTEKLIDILKITRRYGLEHRLSSFNPPMMDDYISEILTTYEKPLIIVVGGDGTCSTVASSYLKYQGKKDHACFLFVPAGTGNDFSRNLGHNHKREIEKVLLGNFETRKVDAIEMTVVSPSQEETKYYGLSYIGFGSSATGAKKIGEKRPNLIGQTRITINALLHSEGITINFEGESKNFGEVLFINVPTMSKGILKTKASLDDGEIDLFLYKEKGARLLGKAIKAGLKPQAGIRKPEFEFTVADTDNSSSAQIDAEVMDSIPPGSKVKIAVLKEAMPVVSIRK